MAKKLLMGNEAMAHAALEAGVRVVAGYPGTPSSEIVETVARLQGTGTAKGVHVEWSTNEKVALELLFGASLAGARGLFTCKQMGLNVASDALMSLNYVSVRGGLVLIVADDPGPISSQTEQDTRRFAAFAKVPVLDPATPEQAFDMVKVAFDLSERFHTPVIVRPTTRINHASTFFDVADETVAPPLPEDGFSRDPSKWVIFPRRAYEAHGEINERLSQIAHAFSTEDAFAPFNRIEEVDGAAYGIIAGGVSAAYTREALDMVKSRMQAADISMPACRFMQIGTPYPFPEEAVAPFTRGLTDVLVVEELDYVLEDEIAKWAGRSHATLNIHGKLTGATRDRGENNVDDIASSIERFLGLSGRLRIRRNAEADSYAALEVPAETLPTRPPVLCPGCPHRGSFYAVKKALGTIPAVLCGDIGCYTLGNAKPLEAVDTCLCMGAGITMAQGLSIADPKKKAVAFVGDSTFFASGMTGLANAAYNGHDITVVVLDNATTAMTGSQPHPGTGATLMGQRNVPLSIEAALAANGFSRIYRADPLDKDSSIVATKAALAYSGPSAVVFQSPCIQLTKPGEPAVVNTERCTGCKKCITEIGCPAIGFNPNATGMRSGDRGQARISDEQCNGCGLCLQVCPFKAISTAASNEDAADLPPKGKPPLHASGVAAHSHPAATDLQTSGNDAEETPATDEESNEEQLLADITVAIPPLDGEPDLSLSADDAADIPPLDGEPDLPLSADDTVAIPPLDGKPREEQLSSDDDVAIPLLEEEPHEDRLSADVTVAIPPLGGESQEQLSAAETVAIPPLDGGSNEAQDDADPFGTSTEGGQDA